MSEIVSDAVEGIDHDLCARDVRALTECMTVLEDTPAVDGADGMFEVVSSSGSTYTVDLYGPACSCPDAQRRDVTCKHARRVMFATGARPIPAWVQRDALDDQLGGAVAAMPRIGKVATDGGHAALSNADAEAESDDARPDGCDCWDADNDLPCWPCWRDGFDMPNPDADGDD